ncbi:MAG: helix-turn-helix domain-containing protein [Candidatus Cloacimonadaceae bacterium]
MKATTYETREQVVKTDHCDNYGTATIVTVVPNQTTPATIRKPVIVTVLLATSKDYPKRLKMSRRKIKAVWLTVERVAELMNCSTRTVWRYVTSHQIKVHKQQIQLGSSKVIKSFLLTETDILMKEMADCELKGIIPGKFIEKAIEVDGKNLNSALIYQYAENISKEGGYYGAL